ncbi:RHS repeat-associated protein [Lysobacter niastensis]|uniref:RHS repeat-associated protein n=1 Tax=Lysobacter niastensis TaxID=380629 RepID=A0ABU1WF26_9GAMM|nr:RHS repeat-associated core domain-containing protein [Lysobacter niastensis]MDR7136159.1 RHS repeat-associated protein [Lysobacter niastensis]
MRKRYVLLFTLLAVGSAEASVKRTTQTEWHSDFAVPIERRIYDATNTLVAKQTWTYNARGQELTASQVDPVSGAARTTTTTYCEQTDVDAGACPRLGLVTAVDGPRNDVSDLITYAYYASDDATCVSAPTICPHRKGDLWKVTDALGHVIETLKYDGAGRALSVKDANGVITDFEYHPRGWLTARKVRGADAGVDSDDLITRIDYYPTGLVSSATLPDGSFTSYVYDAAHRLTDIVDADGNTIHYTLDNAGNRTREDVKGETGTIKRTLSRVYNQLGQMQSERDASNHPTGFTYDVTGNSDTATDALGRIVDNDYDPLNRLAKTIKDAGGIATQTQFQYDTRDQLTAVVDPKGLVTSYSYNAFGDLTQLESPDTGVATFGYDAAGNRISAVDARNELVSYNYDALNRLTVVDYSDTALSIGYVYDAVQADCTAEETFAVGRLTRIDDGSGSTKYCYDRFGNLTRKVQITNGQSFVLQYAYTKAGRLSGISYPDGTGVDYVRDGLGRVTEVGVTPVGGNRQMLLHSATYYPFGPTSGWTFGNGRTFVRTLDLDYRMQAIRSTGSGTGGLDLGYAWDAVGNLASIQAADLTSPPRMTFDYDALNRLIAFRDGPTGAMIESYTYDVTGNRTSFANAGGAQTYDYPTDSHRLTAVDGIGRSYDDAGNTTSIGGTAQEFVYNAAGRMSQVERNDAVVMQYAYNGKGEQVRKYLGVGNVYTLYDESGRWIGDYDSAGSPIQQGVWLDDLPVGVIASNQLHYVEADALSTPRAVIEPERDAAVWKWDIASEAFGNSVPNEDVDGDSVGFVFDLRFAGQRYDVASGLNQNGYRDYESATGRYQQADPLGLLADVSLYAYVSNQPLTFVDESGLAGTTKAPRNFGPGAGGSSADRRKATREFLRSASDRAPPDLRLPPVEADDYKVPDNSDNLTPGQGTCRQLEAFGLDLCGPGPKTQFKCAEYECKDPRNVCTRDNPTGWRRGPFMVGPGYSFANDPNCRCVRLRMIDRY